MKFKHIYEFLHGNMKIKRTTSTSFKVKVELDLINHLNRRGKMIVQFKKHFNLHFLNY